MLLYQITEKSKGNDKWNREISRSQRLVFAFFGSEPIDEIVCYHFA
jgi:hypothetical protein